MAAGIEGSGRITPKYLSLSKRPLYLAPEKDGEAKMLRFIGALCNASGK